MNNQTNYIGRLVDKPKVTEFESGKAVTNFTLAINRTYKNKEGNYDADFINCESWGERGKTLAEYSEKGHRIGVRGETRTYKNDQNHTMQKCVVDNFTFLEPKKALTIDVKETTKSPKTKSKSKNPELAAA